MKEMNKKYIIAVVLSIVMVSFLALASFAFLGSFKKVITNTNVNIIAQNVNNTYFNVTNNVSFALDVDPALMGEDNKNNYVTENTAVLDVSVNPAFDGMSVKCSYDIIFEYDSSSNVYGVSPTPVTTGADKELTLQISGPNGTSDYFEEKNFNLTSRKKVIVSGAEIINSISGMPTVHRWQFTNRFYNLDLDQTALANKSFKGRYYVANVSCDRYEDNTIYSLIKNRYKNNDTYVKLYSESDASTYANPVYYFNGAVEDNNVLFAGFCWKIVRTTDTGGIKMIYNGVQKDEAVTAPIEEAEYANVTNDATYPYTFDSTNKTWTSTNHDHSKTGTITFTVSEPGDYYLNYTMSSEARYDKAYFYKNGTALENHNGTESGTIALTGLTTSDVIKVSYTKDSSASSGSDNVVFSLSKPTDETVKSCNNSGNASQLASTKEFNSSSYSLAYVGYMYNTVYPYLLKKIINDAYFKGMKAYADSVTYDSSTKKYTLDSATATTLNVSTSNGNTLVGKYTCNQSTTTATCTNAFYIASYSSNYIYYYSLSNGDVDGTDNGSNYVFSKSFTYANGTYTLSDTITLNSDTFIANKTSVNTHHYTCFTDGTTCTSLYYVYYINYGTPYYITLTNGKSVEDAINEMLYADDVNKTDSIMKTYIDSWYKDKMTSYTDKLEDTIFCNDRTMDNQSANGWNPNGGSTSTNLYFKTNNTNYSLACTNETDRFSMSNSKARLTYPVGLLSAPEVWLAYRNASYSTYYLNTGNFYWLASPNYFSGINAYGRGVNIAGGMGNNGVSNAWGVRPAVSLKPGTGYTLGDGSYTNPFVVS